jgi:hypothetical protein
MKNNLELKFLIVSARVRYWEDTIINDLEDTHGNLVSCREGDSWSPIIDLDSGKIVNWDEGTVADIHYKVCDEGEYWLADANKNKILKYAGDYVPDSLLCIGDRGYGDYIIMKINEKGLIIGWNKPEIDLSNWMDIS